MGTTQFDVSRSRHLTCHSHVKSELNRTRTKRGWEDQIQEGICLPSSISFRSFWTSFLMAVQEKWFAGKFSVSFGLSISYKSLKRKELWFALHADVFSSAWALTKPPTNFRWKERLGGEETWNPAVFSFSFLFLRRSQPYTSLPYPWQSTTVFRYAGTFYRVSSVSPSREALSVLDKSPD